MNSSAARVLTRPVWTLLMAGGQIAAADGWRMSLVADEGEALACHPGQWVLLTLPAAGGGLRCVGRVEGFDAEELRLDLALSDVAAALWAARAEIGAPVAAELVG